MEYWLPIIFVGLMALAIIVYGILDGYDLGVGILLPYSQQEELARDKMIASIGPFWDANETWLVLAIGILLIAFPEAHSIVMYHTYIPLVIMLLGLIIRGVAFDFRAKAATDHKLTWDRAFKVGSLLTSFMQGYMLGMFVMGFEQDFQALIFCFLSGLGVTAAYTYIGACWLVWKTEANLQQRAIYWAKWAGRLTLLGVILVCNVNLLVNPDVFNRWFEYPLVMFVLLIPTTCFTLFIFNDRLLARLPKPEDRYASVPLLLAALIFLMCFIGLGFSFFPEVIPGQLTIWQAASATESLAFILVGAAVVIPTIIGYTAFSYWVFRGKTTDLQYH